jgi:nicotinamidase-related amidase
MIRLHRDLAVLVLVDLQGKLLAAMPDPKGFLTQIEKLTLGCRALGLPVLCTEHVPDKLGPTVAEIAALIPEKAILAKRSFSCVRLQAFVDRLDSCGRTQVILAGMESHVCILQTAFDLVTEDYEVCVVTDAVSSRKPGDTTTALRAMEQAGVYLTGVESLLFQLLETADDPAFREIHRLVR